MPEPSLTYTLCEITGGSDEARELLQSDNYLLHPGLLDMAMKDIAETEHDAG
jgi:hypothetical protein